MEFLNEIARPAINVWAVLAAGAAGFAVGGLWYSPLMFAKAWMKEMGMTEADTRKGNPGLMLGGALLLTLAASCALAHLTLRWGGWEGGLHVGLLTGAVVALAVGVNSLFEGKSLKLYAINASHHLVAFAVMGAILGAWR